MSTITHVQIGFANPYLICEICKRSARYWHDPDRCNCDSDFYNYPCEHPLGVISRCPTWNSVDGCLCEQPCTK
jgi:hypothetical protein